MNTEHYEKGAPGGKGGQFKPKNDKNGGFTNEDQSFNSEDKFESLKSRQNIVNYKHYQDTIKGILEAPDFYNLSSQVKRNMIDVCATSPIFNLLFLDNIISNNSQYLGGEENIIEIANDKDDKSGIDFAIAKNNGGVDRFDLKANYTDTNKVILRVSKTLNSGTFKDDFFIDQSKKTNYYAFMNIGNMNINSNYNKSVFFDVVRDIYNNPNLSEQEKYEQLNNWINDNVVDSVTQASCNVISRNDLQKNIFENTGLTSDDIRKKSWEMKKILDDLYGNYDNIGIVNQQLGTNYEIQHKVNGVLLIEKLEGSRFPISLVHRLDFSGTGTRRSTYLELDATSLEGMPENRHYNPFKEKVDRIKKPDTLKDRLMEKLGLKGENN